MSALDHPVPNPAALRYLEELQRETMERLGTLPAALSYGGMYHAALTEDQVTFDALRSYIREPSPEAKETLNARLGSFMRQASDARPYCTVYEDLPTIAAMLRIASRYNPVAREAGFVQGPPLLGTMPTGMVNGVAMRVPETSLDIIVFDSGLFEYFHFVTLVLAKCLDYEPEAERFDLFAVRPALIQPRTAEQYASVALQYLERGYSLDLSLDASRPQTLLAGALYDAVLRYALSHEYGHCLAGDLDDDAGCSKPASAAEARAFNAEHERELTADLLGLHLGLRADQPETCFFQSFVGAAVFLASFELLFDVSSLALFGRRPDQAYWVSLGYPSPSTRFARLREAFCLQAVTSAETRDRALRQANAFRRIVSALNEIVLPHLVAAFDGEARLHEIWRMSLRPLAKGVPG